MFEFVSPSRVRDQFPFARHPPIMNRPVRVCTHVNASREFRRFPFAAPSSFPRHVIHFYVACKRGCDPLRIPIFPTRFRRFDTLQPSEPSESLLFPGPARFPQPEISSRGKGNFSSPPLTDRRFYGTPGIRRTTDRLVPASLCFPRYTLLVRIYRSSATPLPADANFLVKQLN